MPGTFLKFPSTFLQRLIFFFLIFALMVNLRVYFFTKTLFFKEDLFHKKYTRKLKIKKKKKNPSFGDIEVLNFFLKSQKIRREFYI